MSAAGSIMIDRKTFFIGLLLAVAVMLAGTFIVTRMMQDRGGEPRGPQPARPMPPPPMQLVKSPHIVDVETDIEGVNALAARGAPKVILVHAPWCGHCRNMMPAFVEAAAAERSVTWMRIDGNVAPSVVRREDLHGFPTIYGVLRDGTVTQHDGGRDVRSLLEFARKVAQAGASHAEAAPVVTFAAAPRLGANSMPHIAIDTETTGLWDAHPIELALVDVRRPLDADAFCERICTSAPIQPAATAVHGITAEDLKACRSEAAVLGSAMGWLLAQIDADGGRPVVLVAHNASFDRAVLERALARCGLALPQGTSWECTMEMSRQQGLPRGVRHTLRDCCERAGVPYVDGHSALADARMCAAVYAHFFADTEEDKANAAGAASVYEAEIADMHAAYAAFAEYYACQITAAGV